VPAAGQWLFSPPSRKNSILVTRKILGRIVGKPSIIRSPSSKLGLDADPVIDRGLNSLLAAKIAFRGLY